MGRLEQAYSTHAHEKRIVFMQYQSSVPNTEGKPKLTKNKHY